MKIWFDKEARRQKRRIKKIRRCGLFDDAWYREQNPDVDFCKISPIEHYLEKGWLEGKDPSNIFSTEFYLSENIDVKEAGVNPLEHYVQFGMKEGRKTCKTLPGDAMDFSMSFSQRLNFLYERWLGRRQYADQIKKNSNARILVCLHLFYMKSWPMIAEYLENLSPYKYDLIVTYVDGMYSEKTLSDIQKWCPEVKLKMYPNQGFDIGSFVDVLRDVNLEEYDIVFKLHSKGTARKFIFIYDMIFKGKDWFFNLFNGVLSGLNVHRTIDKLLNTDKAGLVAAENLIVVDPLHKQHFTGEWAKKLGVLIKKEYHYVAGTCFAIRSSLLKPIQELKLTIDDFELTRRGVFSMAHGMERLVCACVEPAGYELVGNETPHPSYKDELKDYLECSPMRLLHDLRFKLDYDFFYRVMEMRRVVDYRLEEVRLGDIRRDWKGNVIPLKECHPYKYLQGDKDQYIDYALDNKQVHGFDMSVDRYDSLTKSLDDGIDSRWVPVINAADNVIWDGQHRCCYMLHKFGEDYKVLVLKVYFKK